MYFDGLNAEFMQIGMYCKEECLLQLWISYFLCRNYTFTTNLSFKILIVGISGSMLTKQMVQSSSPGSDNSFSLEMLVIENTWFKGTTHQDNKMYITLTHHKIMTWIKKLNRIIIV